MLVLSLFSLDNIAGVNIRNLRSIYSVSSTSHVPPPIDAQHPTGAQHSQTERHTDTRSDNVELAPRDLVPTDRHLDDANAGGGANDAAVRADYGHRRSRFGQHQHLNVKDPALGVHKGYNVWHGGAREQLEAALGVADARCCWGGEDGED